jgi:hypothetical protein
VWKEAVVAYFEALPRNCPWGTRKTMLIMSQSNQSPDQKFNPALSEYETRALSTRLSPVPPYQNKTRSFNIWRRHSVSQAYRVLWKHDRWTGMSVEGSSDNWINTLALVWSTWDIPQKLLVRLAGVKAENRTEHLQNKSLQLCFETRIFS